MSGSRLRDIYAEYIAESDSNDAILEISTQSYQRNFLGID